MIHRPILFFALLLVGFAGAEEALSPAVTFPARSLSLDLAAPAAPVEITGIAITDVFAGKDLTAPFHLQEGVEYDWTLWIQGGVTGFSLEGKVDVGGPVHRINLAENSRNNGKVVFSGRLTPGHGGGDGVLYWCLSTARGDGVWDLARMPVSVGAAPAAADMAEKEIKTAFGADAARLNTRFRLGPGGEITLPLPPALKDVSLNRIGIVSSVAWLSWRNRPKKGQVLAVCTVSDDSNSVTTFPIRLGMDTFPVDKGIARMPRLSPPKEALVADVKDRKASYTQWILEPNRPIRTLTIKHNWRAGVLQVEDIVVIPK